MQKLFARVRHGGRRAVGPAPCYEVTCPCGACLRGKRQARRQVVPCPGCGRPTFVLAASPLPSPDGAVLQAPPPPPRRPLSPWVVPLIAAAVTLALLVLLFLAALPFLGRSAPPPREPDRPPDLHAMTTAGRRALTDGDFHLAVQLLQSALDQDKQHPGILSPGERDDLTQLWRQGDLLDRLSSRSLEEIIEEADSVRRDDEWKARFETDHRGKTVVFDDEVRFDDGPPAEDGRRRPLLRRYHVTASGREARVALEDLNVLQPLARERPQRMLFGGRLSAIRRERDQWVIHFEPDSGVLLTERGAAEAVCPAPLDPALVDVLKRQADWLGRQNEPRP